MFEPVATQFSRFTRRAVIQAPSDPSQIQFTGQIVTAAALLLLACSATLLLKSMDWIAGLVAISSAINGWTVHNLHRQQPRNARLLSLIASAFSLTIVFMSLGLWTLNRGPGLVHSALLLTGTMLSIYGTLRIHAIR